MLGKQLLRRAGVLTLFCFTFLILFSDMVNAQQKENDMLAQAQKLYQKGDYEGSIELLAKLVTKLKAVVEQKKNVAEAYYWLAKNYFDIGDDAKVDENIRKVFETYPGFSKDESNLPFKERVEKIRLQVVGDKNVQATEEPVVKKEADKTISQPASIEKKKKSSSGLLIVAGVVVVGGILAALLLKKKDKAESYDIRGVWSLHGTLHSGQALSDVYTFTGSTTSGTFTDSLNYTGTYTVSGSSVSFKYTSLDLSFTGTFSNQNNMNGSMTYTYSGDGAKHSGTWSATRSSSVMQNSVNAVGFQSIMAQQN